MRLVISALGLLLLVSAACAQQTFDIQSHVKKTYYHEDAQRYASALKSGMVRYCGDYAMVDSGSALDKPLYYLNAADGSVHSVCGGACWHPTTPGQIENCRSQCPPPGAAKCHVKRKY